MRHESLIHHEDQYNPQNVPDTYILAPHSILLTQFLLELATHSSGSHPPKIAFSDLPSSCHTLDPCAL